MKPVTVLNREVLEGDFIFEVALPPDRTEPSLGSGLRPDQGWCDSDLVIAPYDQEGIHG